MWTVYWGHSFRLAKPHMKLTVFRYKVWDHQDDNQAQIPSFYAIRDYVERLEGASVIEEDYLEVEESDFDLYGRISSN